MREILIISKGKAAAGISGPHSASLLYLAYRAGNPGADGRHRGKEKLRLLQLMRDTDGGKGMMHEGLPRGRSFQIYERMVFLGQCGIL